MGFIGDAIGAVTGAVGGLIGDVINPLTGGISNTNKFHAQNPNVDTANQDFSSMLAGGQQNVSQLYGQQQSLAQALQAQASGYGPSPAQAMLNNATQQNIQSAAGVAAGAKGLNPAMAGRVAAQGAASANQQAAGQGAVMGAQQQLNAQHALGGMYGQMGNQQLQNQATLQQALAAQNQSRVGAINGTNQINAGVAGQNSGQQFQTNQGVLRGVGGALGMSDGGEVPGSAEVGGDSPKNDKVPTMLSPGEIVIPRSHSKSPEKAKEFIDALMDKQISKSDPHYGRVVEAHRKYNEAIQKMCMGGKV